MESIISLIVLVIVFALLYYCLTLLPIGEPFKKIVLILAILLFVLILLTNFVPLGMYWPRHLH